MSLTNDHIWFNDNVEIVEMCVCGKGGGVSLPNAYAHDR